MVIDHAPLDQPYTPREYPITLPHTSTTPPTQTPHTLPSTSTQTPDMFLARIIETLGRLDVGSKRFLTSKVDRSVSGHVVQQSCVGPYETPISDYALYADEITYSITPTLEDPQLSILEPKPRRYPVVSGCVTSIGERPLSSLDPVRMVTYTLLEVLTNLAGVQLTRQQITLSANWMWPNPHRTPWKRSYVSCGRNPALLCLQAEGY